MTKIWCSFYTEESSPNKTVSMLASVVCPDCGGNSPRIYSYEVLHGETQLCTRCSGDGLLTSQIPFNSNLLECAISPTFATELFGGWAQAKGQVLKVKYYYCKYDDPNCPNCMYRLKDLIDYTKCEFEQEIYVRIVDLMKDHLCQCGHDVDEHLKNIEEACSLCRCSQYEHRGLDLTRHAFELLAPLSEGLILCEVERV